LTARARARCAAVYFSAGSGRPAIGFGWRRAPAAYEAPAQNRDDCGPPRGIEEVLVPERSPADSVVGQTHLSPSRIRVSARSASFAARRSNIHLRSAAIF
jgi:hypothetical protein